MVIKGGARSGPGELALHLLRADTNEVVRVREFDGVAAETVRGALLEMAATGAGARSRRPLYHASINTARDELMTDEQKARAIDRLADELGLTGQPRVVVEHIKAGREHLHVVWSRIDGETLTAIPDSHNYRRHEEVARELEREFGHQHVQGAHVGREGVRRPTRTPEPHEFMQAARSGITPEEARARLKQLWDGADSGRSFAAGLEDAGWVLAQGDKRDVLVALDPTGETHAINKKLTGLAAKDVRARLADLDAAGLPSVDGARATVRDRLREQKAEDSQPDEIALPPTAVTDASRDNRTAQAAGNVPDSPAEQPQPSFGYTVTLPQGAASWGIIAPAFFVQQPTRTAKAEESVSEGSAVTTPVPEANQGPSQGAETPAKADPARKADAGRLAAIVAAARERLTGLAERLESAIERHRERARVEAERKAEPMEDPSFRASLARGFARLWGQHPKADETPRQREGENPKSDPRPVDRRSIEPTKTATAENPTQGQAPLPEETSSAAAATKKADDREARIRQLTEELMRKWDNQPKTRGPTR